MRLVFYKNDFDTLYQSHLLFTFVKGTESEPVTPSTSGGELTTGQLITFNVDFGYSGMTSLTGFHYTKANGVAATIGLTSSNLSISNNVIQLRITYAVAAGSNYSFEFRNADASETKNAPVDLASLDGGTLYLTKNS